MKNLIDKARKVATKAHKGQVRQWGGKPYITHSEAVAKAVTGRKAIAVGWLHDVVEDTNVTLDELRRIFPADVVDAVDAITRRDGESHADYIERVKLNPLATRVKLADLKHNLSTIPKGHGLEKRYRKALEILRGRG